MKAICMFVLTMALAAPSGAQTTPAAVGITTSRVPALRLPSAVSLDPTPAQPQPPKRHWVTRHPALTGTLIGLGAGFAIGAATCAYAGRDNDDNSGCARATGAARLYGGLTIGGLGAGVGAIVGGLAGSKHLKGPFSPLLANAPAPLPQHLTLHDS
jgi:hypothetical protein